MPFKVEDIPEETKKIHESQNKWRRQSWQKTLSEHGNDIEKLIDKIRLFDTWKTKLVKVNAAQILIPELFMDAYVSIHFAGYALYKYAYMSLRSELETALRLVFFSTHPVEFDWWLADKEWYSTTSDYPYVWGKRYLYFQNLENFKKFEKKCNETDKLFGDHGIKGLYAELSEYIHSGRRHFQTRTDRVSPKYDDDQFRRWNYDYDKVQTYIHIILALGLAEDFKEMSLIQRDNILNTGIGNGYKEKVKETLEI